MNEVLALTITVYFVLIFIAFWGLLSIGQTIGGKWYLRRYKRLHGHPPRREDLSRWMWLLIIPVGMRFRGFSGPPPQQSNPDKGNDEANPRAS